MEPCTAAAVFGDAASDTFLALPWRFSDVVGESFSVGDLRFLQEFVSAVERRGDTGIVDAMIGCC